MRQRLEKEIYDLLFVEDGGLIAAPEPVPAFALSRHDRTPMYAVVEKVADRFLQTLREPSPAVVAAISDAVLADQDIRGEWQAGIDAAGQP